MDFLEYDDIGHNILIIKINKSFRPDMTDDELYEATRASWKISMERAKLADYALAVFNKKIVEVYKIDGWLPAGTIPMKTRKIDLSRTDRYEFVGEVARPDIRNEYVGKDVSHLYKYGEANPVKLFSAKTGD